MRFHRKISLAHGVSPPVHALIQTLRDPGREVGDWIYAALTLPQEVKTPGDRKRAVYALMDCLAAERTGPSARNRAFRVGLLGFGAVCCAVAIVLSLLLLRLGLPLPEALSTLGWFISVFMVNVIILACLHRAGRAWRRVRYDGLHAVCAQSLGTLKDVDALSVLLRHATEGPEVVSREARNSVCLLVPLLLNDPGRELDAKESESLARILTEVRPESARNILLALERVGSTSAIFPLAAYRDYCPFLDIKSLTERVLAVLQQRSMDDRQRSTLLRPSGAEAHLLHISSASTESDPVQLLRSMTGEE